MSKSAIHSGVIKPIEDAFLSIGYERSLLKRNYAFTDFFAPKNPLRIIDLAVFAQDPTDYRSACFCVKFFPEPSRIEPPVSELRAFGAPHIFIVRNGTSEWWTNSEHRCFLQDQLGTDALPGFIQARKGNWKPEKMLRLKSGFPKPESQQIDFVDLGLLPALEREASVKIDSLIRRILHNAEREFRQEKLTFDASLVFNITFRLLTAKLLKDRGIQTDPVVDLSKPVASLRAASQYYGAPVGAYMESLPMELLKSVSKEIGHAFSLRNLSVDILTYVYENTFVSGKSRKSLGIHSTPSYVADYILSQMPIEDIPRTKWNVLDPMSGHGIFLIAAMRRMRSFLPSKWSSAQRHKFYVDRLHGIEIDPFSLDVARMCLMLADFPEANSWDLRQGDVFAGKTLESSVANASIIVGNPPFQNLKDNDREIPKPAYLLQKALPCMTDGSLIGMVLPRSFLDGTDYKNERAMFLSEFQILSLTSLPDRVFLHSDAETATIVARKDKSKAKVFTICREVKEHHRERFRTGYDLTWEDKVPQTYFTNQLNGRLNLPMLRKIWERLQSLPCLGDIAEVKIGVQYKPIEDPTRFHQMVRQEPFPKSRPGIYNVTDGFKAFAATDTLYMSTDRTFRRRKAWDLDWGSPKVVVPASRTSRGPWRYVAAIDKEGRIISRRFYAVWPKNEEIEVEFLAAILNSPVAQAFVYTHSAQRDIPARVYKSIPIPQGLELNGSIISSLVNRYVEYLSTDPDKAKATLLHIDVEVLKLYGLPVQLEQELLNVFWGDTRRRVPFRFTGYVPTDIPSPLVEELKTQLSPHVIQFCSQKSILTYLQRAIETIYDCFPSVKNLRVLPEQDPETDEEWLLIDVTLEGNVTEILDLYDEYTRRWVTLTPLSVRDNIRVTYNIC